MKKMYLDVCVSLYYVGNLTFQIISAYIIARGIPGGDRRGDFPRLPAEFLVDYRISHYFQLLGKFKKKKSRINIQYVSERNISPRAYKIGIIHEKCHMNIEIKLNLLSLTELLFCKNIYFFCR